MQVGVYLPERNGNVAKIAVVAYLDYIYQLVYHLYCIHKKHLPAWCLSILASY